MAKDTKGFLGFLPAPLPAITYKNKGKVKNVHAQALFTFSTKTLGGVLKV